MKWSVLLGLPLLVGCNDFDSLRACARLTDGGLVEASACPTATGGGSGGGTTGGGGGGGGALDAGADAGSDAGSDAGADAGTDAGADAGELPGRLGPWDGGIEVLRLVPAWRASLPIAADSTPRFGTLVPLTRSLWAHVPRRTVVASNRPQATLIGLDPLTGSYVTAPEDLLLDVATANATGTVLSLVTWNRVGDATDGGDRGFLGYQASSGAFVQTRQVLPLGSTEVVMPLRRGAWLEVERIADRARIVSDAGNWPLSCPVLGTSTPLRGLADGGEALLLVGACDGGLELLVAAEGGELRSGTPVRNDDFTVLANRRDDATAVLVEVRFDNQTNSADLHVSRVDERGRLLSGRRFAVDGGTPQVRAVAVDDFDQPLLLLMGPRTVALTEALADGGAGASAAASTSSAMMVLQLDAQLNPARLLPIDYPVDLRARSLAASGGAWVTDVNCLVYDGGADALCPSNRTSMAMRLVLPDGGTP